jgi:hypothetical protein
MNRGEAIINGNIILEESLFDFLFVMKVQELGEPYNESDNWFKEQKAIYETYKLLGVPLDVQLKGTLVDACGRPK